MYQLNVKNKLKKPFTMAQTFTINYKSITDNTGFIKNVHPPV